jgi:septum formation protein
LKIYLASLSPRRQELLKLLGIKYQVLASKVSELPMDLTPVSYAQVLAKMKVESVSRQVRKGVIIGMDTIVVLGKRKMGKPKNKNAAGKMLSMLSGKTHRVITGIYLLRLPKSNSISSYEMTKVKFRKLSGKEIESYIKTKEPYDKAGAYGIQGQAGLFVESINGDYFNVVGFPVAKFLKLFKKLIGSSQKIG